MAVRFSPVNTQTVRVLPASKFLEMTLPEPARGMHMDHDAYFRQLCPPWRTRYMVSGDVLYVGFTHYSLDVPYDLAKFVD